MLRWQRLFWRRTSIQSLLTRSLFLVWFLLPVVTMATQTDVVVCSDPDVTYGDAELHTLLLKDIESLGLTVSHLDSCGLEDGAALEAVGEENRAAAVVHLDYAEYAAVIWVHNEKTGNAVTRTFRFDDIESQEASLRSLGISELLRAAFVELKTTPWASRAEPTLDAADEARASGAGLPATDSVSDEPPPPTTAERDPSSNDSAADVTDTTETDVPDSEKIDDRKASPLPDPDIPRRRGTILLEALGAVTVLTFGHAPIAHLAIGGYLQLRRWVGPEVLILIPLSPLVIREDEGRVSVRKGILAIGTRLEIPTPAKRLHFAASIGVGMDVTVVSADAERDLHEHLGSSIAALPYGRLEMRIQLTRRISLTVGALLGTDIPRTRVTVVDKGVIMMSPLLLSGYLGMDVGF